MRTLLTTVTLLAVVLAARPDDARKVRLRLVDDNGKDVPGIVRITRDDTPLPLPGLLNRLRGLKDAEKSQWHVVPPGGAETSLPNAALKLEALAGLESATTRQDIDPAKGDIVVKLAFPFRPAPQWVAGNTHLHLRDLTAEQADDYLRQIPAADHLKVLFLSYLERDKDDKAYITNRYPVGPVAGFETTGVLMSNGEEHRHNFEGFGQGYGHVMFLDIKQLVKPVSLGPGITNAGDDDRALRPGLDDAHKQGGTILWCHNTNGYEALPSLLAGRVHALNVYDGSRTGSYEERYYRFLNIGQRLPISTGTDWFLYDFTRVYARVPERLSSATWLDALKAGRCFATNGPLLTLTVDGRALGDVIDLTEPRTVRIEATARGRHDFERLQLIHNGKVIQTQASAKDAGGFAAKLVREVRLDEPGWFAVRIDATTRNEFDHKLFAHSSPIYVERDKQRILDLETARSLQQEMETARDALRKRGKFSNDAARDRVLSLYEQAEKEIVRRINQRGK